MLLILGNATSATNGYAHIQSGSSNSSKTLDIQQVGLRASAQLTGYVANVATKESPPRIGGGTEQEPTSAGTKEMRGNT